MLLGGDFVAETDTRSEATGEVVRLIVDEFTRLQRERTGDAELAGAQAYMTGSFPLTIETPGAIARQVLNVIMYDLPLDELRTYRQRANSVTPDDISRVARSYLQPDRLSIVMVGNATAFKDQLQRAGFGKYELIPLEQLDLMAPDLKRR
jgi:zinc protease